MSSHHGSGRLVRRRPIPRPDIFETPRQSASYCSCVKGPAVKRKSTKHKVVRCLQHQGIPHLVHVNDLTSLSSDLATCHLVSSTPPLRAAELLQALLDSSSARQFDVRTRFYQSSSILGHRVLQSLHDCLHFLEGGGSLTVLSKMMPVVCFGHAPIVLLACKLCLSISPSLQSISLQNFAHSISGSPFTNSAISAYLSQGNLIHSCYSGHVFHFSACLPRLENPTFGPSKASHPIMRQHPSPSMYQSALE